MKIDVTENRHNARQPKQKECTWTTPELRPTKEIRKSNEHKYNFIAKERKNVEIIQSKSTLNPRENYSSWGLAS